MYLPGRAFPGPFGRPLFKCDKDGAVAVESKSIPCSTMTKKEIKLPLMEPFDNFQKQIISTERIGHSN